MAQSLQCVDPSTCTLKSCALMHADSPQRLVHPRKHTSNASRAFPAASASVVLSKNRTNTLRSFISVITFFRGCEAAHTKTGHDDWGNEQEHQNTQRAVLDVHRMLITETQQTHHNRSHHQGVQTPPSQPPQPQKQPHRSVAHPQSTVGAQRCPATHTASAQRCPAAHTAGAQRFPPPTTHSVATQQTHTADPHSQMLSAAEDQCSRQAPGRHPSRTNLHRLPWPREPLRLGDEALGGVAAHDGAVALVHHKGGQARHTQGTGQLPVGGAAEGDRGPWHAPHNICTICTQNVKCQGRTA